MVYELVLVAIEAEVSDNCLDLQTPQVDVDEIFGKEALDRDPMPPRQLEKPKAHRTWGIVVGWIDGMCRAEPLEAFRFRHPDMDHRLRNVYVSWRYWPHARKWRDWSEWHRLSI